MYCPTCLNNTLELNSRGVIRLLFNGKSKNTSLFSYNLATDTQEKLERLLIEKVKDYFKWYGDFQNKTPIKSFECYTTDTKCKKGCIITPDSNKASVINVLFSSERILEILRTEGKISKIDIDIKY
jgi:hypothetical protein